VGSRSTHELFDFRDSFGYTHAPEPARYLLSEVFLHTDSLSSLPLHYKLASVVDALRKKGPDLGIMQHSCHKSFMSA
jgi:hypothetical protein